MLKISANDAQLTVVACGPITSDRIDLPCEITLSKEFDGLAVTVVFKAGDVQRDVAMLGSPVHVPAECLEQAGEVLMVGIWAGDGSGRPTIPTVWASAGTIRTGVLPSGYDPDEPEPDWAAQVQQAAAQAVATANSVRADADAGVFDGEDGYSPTATVTQGDGSATITITDKSGTTTASVSNGTDGTDGTDGFSPTVDVQEIEGGHEVTITDADGSHSFDVLDGDPSAPGSITDAMLAPDGIKAQVAQLWGNQLVGELSGTIATAADAYSAPPMALTVDGVSTQESYTGKNLLDVSDWPGALSVYLNTSIYALPISLAPNSTYTVSTNSPNGSTVSGADDVFAFLATDTSPTTASSGAHNGSPRTVTTGADGILYVGIRRDTSNKFNFGGGTYYIQLEAGSTATSYEPYIGGKPLPNPDSPQPIMSVDALALEVVGKNLLDPTDVVTGTYINSSGVRANGSANTSTNFIPIIGGETYTVSFESAPGAGNYLAWYTDADQSTVTWSRVDLRTAASTTATAPSDAKFVRFSFKSTLLNSAQLEHGSTATAYEPYAGTTVPDLLPEGTDLRSLPDGTKDELHLAYLKPSTREGWAWYGRTLTALVGETTTAATDGVTGTVGVDVMSTTGEIADGPTVLYKLASAQTTTIDPIELPELPAPNCTVWCDGGSATPSFVMQYVQDTNIVIADLRAALADLATS